MPASIERFYAEKFMLKTLMLYRAKTSNMMIKCSTRCEPSSHSLCSADLDALSALRQVECIIKAATRPLCPHIVPCVSCIPEVFRCTLRQ